MAYLDGRNMGPIATAKGRDTTAALLLAFYLGPLGVLIGLVLPSHPLVEYAGQEGWRECPFCAERVRAQAVVCRYCQHELPGLPTPEPTAYPEVTSTARTSMNDSKQNTVIWICLGIALVVAVVALLYDTGLFRSSQAARPVGAAAIARTCSKVRMVSKRRQGRRSALQGGNGARQRPLGARQRHVCPRAPVPGCSGRRTVSVRAPPRANSRRKTLAASTADVTRARPRWWPAASPQRHALAQVHAALDLVHPHTATPV
jgi:hypothetical protein